MPLPESSLFLRAVFPHSRLNRLGQVWLSQTYLIIRSTAEDLNFLSRLTRLGQVGLPQTSDHGHWICWGGRKWLYMTPFHGQWVCFIEKIPAQCHVHVCRTALWLYCHTKCIHMYLYQPGSSYNNNNTVFLSEILRIRIQTSYDVYCPYQKKWRVNRVFFLFLISIQRFIYNRMSSKKVRNGAMMLWTCLS